MSTPGNQRLFSDFYAAAHQRERFEQPYWEESTVGQLRFDILTTERIIIPDTHLIDGAILLRMGPDGIREALAISGDENYAPIEIKTRSKTLEESLVKFFRRPGSQNLNPFPLNLLVDDDIRSDFAQALANCPEGRLDQFIGHSNHAASDIAEFLRDLLQAEGLKSASKYIDAAEAGWRRWIEAEQAGKVAATQWQGSFDLPSALLGANSLNVEKDLSSKSGRALYQRVLNRVVRGSNYRSDISAVLIQALRSLNSDAELSDLRVIDSWYSQGRQRAIARQHGAAYAHVQDARVSVGLMQNGLALASFSNMDHLTASSGVVEVDGAQSRLAVLSTDEFRSLLFRTRDFRRKWIRDDDPGALKKIFRVVSGSTAEKGGWKASPLIQMFAPVGASATGVVLGSPWQGLMVAGASFVISRAGDIYLDRAPTRRIVEYVRTRRNLG